MVSDILLMTMWEDAISGSKQPQETEMNDTANSSTVETPAPNTPADPFIGILFEGKYRIDKKLGEGGMGVVYRAKHIFMERPVAIKFLHADRVADSATLERFKREAVAAGRIQHPNATAVTDFGVSDKNIFYLVMEYLEGRSLREKLRDEGPLSCEETAKIIYQTCEAVESAHKNNIIHRDLKPDNIFLQVENGIETVKVLDFGIAKITHTGNATAGLTEAGMIVGTPYYMSPEQCQSDNLDPRADIYSIGVIIYEMLTAHLPFTGDSPLAIALKHVSEPVPSPSKYIEDLDEDVEEVILRALSKRRQDRQQSAKELAEEFANAVGYAPNNFRMTGDLSRSTFDDLPARFNTGGNRNSKTDAYENKPTDIQTHISSGRATSELSGRDSATINEQGKMTGKISGTKKSTGGKKGNKGISTGETQRDPRAESGGTLAMGRNESDGATIAMKSEGPQKNTVNSASPSRTPIYIGAAVLVLVIGVFGVFKLMSGGPQPTAQPTQTIGGNSTATPTPKLEGGMIAIPGGTFRMGRDGGKDQFGEEIPIIETPANNVTVKPFYIGKYEITNKEYAEFLQASGHKAPPNWSGATEGAAEQPITNVDLNDCIAYCEWRAKKENKPYRLPTEEEWEFAARGTESRLFPWGALWEPNLSNTKELTGGKGTLLPITSKSLLPDVSPFGVIAMSGNVSEWTSSDAKLYPGNDADLQSGLKVARGTNYANPKQTSAATFRILNVSTYKDPRVGFRIAMDKK